MQHGPIILLCGFGGSGKDAVAEVLIQLGWHRLALADPLKQLAWEAGRWNGTKTELGRRQLQSFGDDCRKRDPLIFVRKLLDSMEALYRQSPKAPIVVTDARYANEIVNLRDRGGLLWRVERPDTTAANDHQSEIEHLRFRPDRIIHNDGTLDDLTATVFHAIDKAGLL